MQAAAKSYCHSLDEPGGRSGENKLLFSQAYFIFFQNLIQIWASVHELGHMTFCERCPRFGMTPYLAGRRRILNLDGAEFCARAVWLLTTISGKSLAKIVRSNEWTPRDSVTSDQRIAARIVESGNARASTG